VKKTHLTSWGGIKGIKPARGPAGKVTEITRDLGGDFIGNLRPENLRKRWPGNFGDTTEAGWGKDLRAKGELFCRTVKVKTWCEKRDASSEGGQQDARRGKSPVRGLACYKEIGIPGGTVPQKERRQSESGYVSRLKKPGGGNRG